MKTVVSLNCISDITTKQIENFFPLSNDDKLLIINLLQEKVIDRLENNFKMNHNKYYFQGNETYFNMFHSGQYCIFLYYLSNEIWKSGNSILADKIYYLNKIMNGVDLFYEVELPDYFSLDHPVGSVIGRAHYSNGFSFSQNCTVGNNKGIYPVLGKNFIMCANSMIIGNCHVGDNVTLGAGCLVKDQDIPSNSLVFGQSPNLIIKQKK